jgi:glycerophosphoryl diester phosphodiesterase
VGADKAAKVGRYRRSHINENTVLSFVMAASLGAEYVEFGTSLLNRLK